MSRPDPSASGPAPDFRRGVPADVRAEVRRVCRGFARLSPVRHPVPVIVVPHGRIYHPTDPSLWAEGFFVPYADGTVRVAVAAGLADLREEWGYPRAAAVAGVGLTVLHELAHYEQWASGRPLTERGVAVRARSLYRRVAALDPSA